MFRGYMPALTLLVFGIGTGIGLGWSHGLIPLTITPAKTGTLSLEVSHREPLPPPNDPQVSATRRRPSALVVDDPEVFEQQSEPGAVDSHEVATTTEASSESSPTTPKRRAVETDEESVRTASIESSPSAPSRIRRAAVQLDVEQGIEESSAQTKRRRVKATAFQDPTDSATSRSEEPAEAKSTELSPSEQMEAAAEKLAAGETLPAHREFSRLYWNHKDFRPQLQETMDSTAKAIFFQPKPHYVEPYEIQAGDRLEVIAKKYQLSWEYVAKLNRTDPKRIQLGQKLKVMKGPFGAVVDLKEFALTVHLQGYYVKRYQVGIGKESSSPIGKFTVLSKLENPQYTDRQTGRVIAGDDPTNPLGRRWIDLGDSYGIHGTIDPDSIGKAESRGCIRMQDKDIIEVYDFLVKGSEVILRK